MVHSKKEVTEVYQHVYNITTDDWTEVPPDTRALMHEIASMVDRDEKRNRIAMARDARLEIARLNEEIDDRDTGEDEQEHTHDIWREGLKVHTTESDENDSNSETDSIETIEYEYEDKNEQVKLGSEEENEEVKMTNTNEEKFASC